MKYLIDLTNLSEKNTGIEYVAENAALSFIKQNKKDSFILVFNFYVPKVFRDLIYDGNINIKRLKTRNFNTLRIFELPKIIKNSKADLNFFFAFPCPYFAQHKNSITLIHDLTAFKFAKTQTITQSIKWKAMIKKCIRKDKYILTVSDTIKYEIANMFNRDDSKRIYPGIKNPVKDSESSILNKYSLEKNKYILSVGTYEPRKNYDILINAYEDLYNEKKITDELVIVGKTGWKTQVQTKCKNIRLLDYQSDEDLSSLYKNAKFFISSSIYEGFGLPVIEAIKHNTPVLLSDISTYRETTKNKAVYFNQLDKDEIKRLILFFCNNKIEAISKDICREYTWENYANELHHYLTKG